MRNYRITVKREFEIEYDIEAENEDEAIEIAEKKVDKLEGISGRDLDITGDYNILELF